MELAPEATVRFLCSARPIDSLILDESGFGYMPLPMTGFSFRPTQLPNSLRSFVKSRRIAAHVINESKNPVVIGIGGFASGPSCLAAHKLGVPIAMLNVDIIPGRANRIVSRWADEIFVQFEDTLKYFAGSKAEISVVGCPLRKAFDDMDPAEAIKILGLEKGKKVLLITGASSGAANINEAMVRLLDELEQFAAEWQIVHLTGLRHFEEIEQRYASAKISHKVLPYCNDMAALLACAHLVIGRSGAVSIAEYAAAMAPSICMPYPYHKDKHQYLNAAKLVEAGATVIVDDVNDPTDRAERLWRELEPLMKNEARLEEMVESCSQVARLDAAAKIAQRLLEIGEV